MKNANQKLILFSVIILFTSIACKQTSSFSKKPIVENRKIIGQTAPADMVFVPGNGKVSSFYMGVSEEPNINYLIYLDWLKAVFEESYPEVLQSALPKQHNPTSLLKFNDPYINNYMTHPAFSYYPVTGLSWMQIQNYLQWKSDRLNEAILIKEGILNFNPEQKDEDSFNFEAYLNGQYEGDTRKNLRDLRTGGERRAVFNDGILFSGYRLPTEAEWEYASQQKFQKKIDRKRCLNPFSKDAINHPYGQDYFPLFWSHTNEETIYRVRRLNFSYRGPYSKDVRKLNNRRNKGFEYIPEEGDRNGVPQRLTSIADYDPDFYGLINMETNVREWLLDFYETEFDSTLTDHLVLLEKNGFKLKGAALVDERGHNVEKDSLGRMRYFRVLGVGYDGKPLEVGIYNSEQNRLLNKVANLQVSKVALERRLIITERRNGDYKKNRKEYRDQVEMIKYYMADPKDRDPEVLKRIQKLPNFRYNSYSTMQKQYLEQNLLRLKATYDYYDPLVIEAEIGKTTQEIEATNTFLKNNPAPQRLIKGGTWQNPGKQRMGLEETASNVEVGFRCVLPYTGMPVKKQYKVKWKR